MGVQTMRILIVGAGWVGITMSVFFSSAHNVTLLDIDEKKIETIKTGESPIVETGISKELEQAVKSKHIQPVSSIGTIGSHDLVMICVGTPESPNGQVNLQFVEAAAESILRHIDAICNDYCAIVIKSTVPPGTTRSYLMQPIVKKQLEGRIGVVFNPEFLREGSALEDARNPDRIIIGATDERAYNLVRKMFEQCLETKSTPYLLMSPESAELCKYASNSFLAMKISFANEIADIAESIPHADVADIMAGVGADHRIESSFFGSGAGYGGSCFPKDVQGLASFAEERSIDTPLLRAIQHVNSQRPQKLVNMLTEAIGNIRDKKVTILGLAFKPETNDARESPALKILDILSARGAEVWIHDPLANFIDLSSQQTKDAEISDNLDECLRNSLGCILVTDWPVYFETGLDNLTKLMSRKVFIDGRRVFATQPIPNDVFYQTVGTSALKPRVEQS